MASFNFEAEINSILDPKIFQVVGSTPASLMDSVKEVGMENKRDLAVRFVALSIFSASVNKKTAEGLFMESDMGSLRTNISRKFTINNSLNMTALSLAGHCFLSIDTFSQISFAREFRKKMGQSSIWDGPLTSGSLSEKQRKILEEKAKVHTKASARDFADWFTSYTGITAKLKAPSSTPTGGSADALLTQIPADVLRYARSKYSDEKILEVLRARGLDATVKAYRKGMSSVEEEGTVL